MTEVLSIGIYHFLTVAVILFVIGLLGMIFSKNLLKVLISAEIMFSGIIINFATFSSYTDTDTFKGGIFALFIIVFTALQTGVGIAVILNIFKFKNSVNSDNIGELKG